MAYLQQGMGRVMKRFKQQSIKRSAKLRVGQALKRCVLACWVWALPGLALAASIDGQQSEIKATFTQFGVPVTGEFLEFDGTLVYNPKAPEATRASLQVKTSTYDLGDDQYNAEVAGPDWFDVSNHPQATFVLDSVQVQGEGLLAAGQFTLRGTTKSLSFPVQVESQGVAHVFTGQAEIKRLEFGVGQGDWGDTALVEDEVQIDFKLVVPK